MWAYLREQRNQLSENRRMLCVCTSFLFSTTEKFQRWMVWSGELHQQRHPWLKTDPFARTLHRRLQEEDKVTFTWLSNLTENSSILKPSNWSSVNMNVYILKHFCKPWEDTSLDISRGTNCWNGNFVLMYLVVIFASFYVIFLPPFKIEKLKVTHQSIKKKKTSMWELNL